MHIHSLVSFFLEGDILPVLVRSAEEDNMQRKMLAQWGPGLNIMRLFMMPLSL
jgi:hypothetical protein